MENIEDTFMKNNKATYDAAAKEFLSNKSILAWLLKYCVAEFKDYGITEIAEKYIGNDVEVGIIPIEPDKTNAVRKILPEGTEYRTVTEGTTFFDIRFSAYAPDNGEMIKLIINVEAQKKNNPEYHLITRGIFHCARLLSSQYSIEFEEPHFDKIKKVYSIWLTFTSPQPTGGITQYKMKEHHIVGNISNAKKNYDLLQVIMVYVGSNGKKIENRLLKMLHLLFRKRANAVSKEQQLKDEFGIELSTKMAEELNIMCNLGEGIAEEAMAEGLAKGLEQGIEKGKIQNSEEIAIKMLRKGKKTEEIQEWVDLSSQRIEQLASSIKGN